MLLVRGESFDKERRPMKTASCLALLLATAPLAAQVPPRPPTRRSSCSASSTTPAPSPGWPCTPRSDLEGSEATSISSGAGATGWCRRSPAPSRGAHPGLRRGLPGHPGAWNLHFSLDRPDRDAVIVKLRLDLGSAGRGRKTSGAAVECYGHKCFSELLALRRRRARASECRVDHIKRRRRNELCCSCQDAVWCHSPVNGVDLELRRVICRALCYLACGDQPLPRRKVGPAIYSLGNPDVLIGSFVRRVQCDFHSSHSFH